MNAKNFSVRRWGIPGARLIIAVHSAVDPSDSEWQPMLDAAQQLYQATGGAQVLALTDGGKPDARQRQSLVSAAKASDLRCAVMSERALVRGAITAMAWLGANMSAFAPEQGIDALGYLGINTAHGDAIANELDAMCSEFNDPSIIHRACAGLRIHGAPAGT